MIKRGLYAITDEKLAAVRGMTLSDQVWQFCRGGAVAIQLRAKSLSPEDFLVVAKNAQHVCEKFSIPCILNDQVEIAEELNLPVHIGQEDLEERGHDLLFKLSVPFGLSTHTVGQALLAQEWGAAYIGVGPIFATPTKPTYQPIGLQETEKMCASVSIPTVAIGGIDEDKVMDVVRIGATNVAMVRAVCGAPDISSFIESITSYF